MKTRVLVVEDDPKVLSALPPADLTIERIGDLLDYDLGQLRTASSDLPSSVKVTQ